MTYYRYNVQGNVTRVITEPYRPSGGESDFTATRLIYAKNGSTVTYVMGETWNEGETCPDENYAITYAREFRYDGARARYLSRELDTTALLSGSFVPVSDTWTDYDGDTSYGDFTVDGPTVTDGMWYEPGIAQSASAQDRTTAAYYHADLIGTTRDVSVAGAGIGAAVYTAFGEQVAGTAHRYGYVGVHGYETDDTGAFPYQHVGARYYDPATGRFLQRDPIGIHGGTNVYAYVLNLPTVLIDPSGYIAPPSSVGGPTAGQAATGAGVIIVAGSAGAAGYGAGAFGSMLWGRKSMGDFFTFCFYYPIAAYDIIFNTTGPRTGGSGPSDDMGTAWSKVPCGIHY